METSKKLHTSKTRHNSDGTKIFLTEKDREREERVTARLGTAWDFSFLHMPMESYVDFIAVRHNRPVGWVEVISRDYTWETLRGMGGVVLKHKTLRTMQRLAEVPLGEVWFGSRVVWEMLDGLYYVDVTDIHDPVLRRFTDPRRANRNDVNELVALITDLKKVPDGDEISRNSPSSEG